MLSKDDLAQIGKLIEAEGRKTRQELGGKIEKVYEDMSGVLNEILTVVSEEHGKHEKRIERLEERVGLPHPQ